MNVGIGKNLGLLLFLVTLFVDSTAIAGTTQISQASVGGSINRSTLKVGSQGDSVSELQAALKLLGFYTGSVNGIYSETTANAVSRFQQAAGLSANGIVDRTTWQKLFPNEPVTTATNLPYSEPKPNTTVVRTQPIPRKLPILSLGMRGPDVVKIQTRLQKLGFFKGRVDGYFGKTTQAAVKAAQTRYRLEADGVVGQTTWESLWRHLHQKR
jgi:peptidoglycan hydrolase-like protein with peptidoglycan-binding domain